MSQLAQLQHAFQRYLMDDSTRSSRNFIVNDAKVGAKKRLDIYHNAYRLRIIEALASPYTMLKKLLGEQLFTNIAGGYLKSYPSTYPNLRWYGDSMADYLRSALPQHLVAAEMAQFEWALAATFDSADVPVVKLEDLAQIPPENWGALHFVFQSGMQIFPLQSNVVAIWKSLDADEIPPEIEQDINLKWLIWRQNLNANFRSIDEVEASVLLKAQAGATFGELCEQLFETSGEHATMQAAQYLAGWLEAELISQLSV